MCRRILGLSKRISVAAPAMKPFVRFGCRDGAGDAVLLRSAWDFDHFLQKKLLDQLRRIASADDIIRMGTEQWKENLLPDPEPVHENPEPHRNRLDLMADHFRDRYRWIQQALPRNGTLLYIGCGRGHDCFVLQRGGKIRVTGIDNHLALLDNAGQRGDLFRQPVRFAAMDVLDLGFKPESFDGFLIEFYGFLPLRSQVDLFQRDLARILKREGTGFVVAGRRKYSSYWFLMNSSWPSSMIGWLAGQSSLDFAFTEADACEERLAYGFYSWCHTRTTLEVELSRTFEVLACEYTLDPRYVLATVRKRDEVMAASGRPSCVPECMLTTRADAEIEATIDKIEALCNYLGSHATEVADFFARGGTGGECLKLLHRSGECFLRLFGQVTASSESSRRGGRFLPIHHRLEQSSQNPS